MTKQTLNFNKKPNENSTMFFGVASLLLSLAGIMFLPLSVVAIISGHLALNANCNNYSINICAKAGLTIGYGWLIFTLLSMVIYLLS